MKALAISLVALAILSGCAVSNLYLGPALSTCRGPVTGPEFSSGACLTGADYDVARRKAKHSLAESAGKQDH